MRLRVEKLCLVSKDDDKVNDDDDNDNDDDK